MPGVGSLRWACTFHVLGDANLTRRQPVFWWNMGLRVSILSEMFFQSQINLFKLIQAEENVYMEIIVFYP